MFRKIRKAELQEAQYPAAPFLFGDDELPIRLDLVRTVSGGAHKHTGPRLLHNDSPVLRMAELLSADWDLKRVAKAFSMSEHSVRAAREELVKRGELAPFKESVVARYEHASERGIENYLAPAAQIPVGLGIILHKRALTLDEPTSIAQAIALAKDLTLEKLNAGLSGDQLIHHQPISVRCEPKLRGRR